MLIGDKDFASTKAFVAELDRLTNPFGAQVAGDTNIPLMTLMKTRNPLNNEIKRLIADTRLMFSRPWAQCETPELDSATANAMAWGPQLLIIKAKYCSDLDFL